MCIRIRIGDMFGFCVGWGGYLVACVCVCEEDIWGLFCLPGWILEMVVGL